MMPQTINRLGSLKIPIRYNISNYKGEFLSNKCYFIKILINYVQA